MIIFTTFCAIFLISCNCEENLTTTTELIDTSTTLIEDTVITTVISDDITTTIEDTDTTTVFSDDITTTIVDTVITTEGDDTTNTGNLVLLCMKKSERSIFQTFWKTDSCPDFLFLELETSNFGYLHIF